MAITLREAEAGFGVRTAQHLTDELVPVLGGLQIQGDVAVIPAPAPRPWSVGQVPVGGVAVVRGEAGGHDHVLLTAGAVTYAANPAAARVGAGSADLGVLHVPGDAAAYLAHLEHGYTGIGPGTYLLRRQREYTGPARAARRVVD